MRLIACGVGNVHVIGPCPKCYDAQGGLLLGTVANTYEGRVQTICLDCDETVDYYINAQKEKLWKLEPVEGKGIPSSGPHIKAKKAEEEDTQVKTKEPVLI
ncbi:hypothetical protein ACFLTQ_01730 [Chloroflexota bacterium]